MSAYGALSGFYDALTRDVPYTAFADYYEALFAEAGGGIRSLLDLCCGTGALACLMAGRGYELIAADASSDMLAQAAAKADVLAAAQRPLFICQPAESLDLYGTVDAACSSLDSLGYVSPAALPEVFRRLHLFIRPGGLLVFDLRTPEFLARMDGQVWVDETEDVLCLWRGSFDAARQKLVYGMDLFQRRGALWRREGEEHVEYVHRPETVCALLEAAGFSDVRIRRDGPMGGADRLYFTGTRSS